MSKNIYNRIYDIYFINVNNKPHDTENKRLNNVRYTTLRYLYEIVKYKDDNNFRKFYNKYIAKIKFSNKDIIHFDSFTNVYDLLDKVENSNNIIFYNELNYNLSILLNLRKFNKL